MILPFSDITNTTKSRTLKNLVTLYTPISVRIERNIIRELYLGFIRRKYYNDFFNIMVILANLLCQKGYHQRLVFK